MSDTTTPSTTTPAPAIYLTPTSGGSIIETSGVPLTMSQDGTILQGGVPLPGTPGSIAMAYYNNLIYGENYGSWYYYDGTYWHQTTTPPAGITPTGLPFTPTPGAPPPATPTAIPSATPTTPTTTPVTTTPTAISIGQNTDQLRFLANQNETDTAVTPPASPPVATLTLADTTGDSLTVPGGSGAPESPTASLGSVCWHDVLQPPIISHS